jgi:hypothetical protein
MGEGVGQIWFRYNVFFQRADSFVELSLFHLLRGFDQLGIGSPRRFRFDGFVHFVLETGVP